MRHAAKRDANEAEIVEALELAGWTVIPVSDTGVMDLLCIRRGIIKFLEVKGPKGKLTPAQERTFARIHAAGGTVHVVRTPAEALHAVALGVESELGPREPILSQPPTAYRFTWFKDGVPLAPAYQKAQTEAVVPKRRMLAVKCECGHARGDHTSGRGVCMDGKCECVQFMPKEKNP